MVDEKFTPKSLLSCAQYLIVNIDFLCQHIQSKHIASLFNYNVATDTGEFGVIRNSMLSTFLTYPAHRNRIVYDPQISDIFQIA